MPPTDDTTPAWPDPARPGVPLNAEQDGWHWLKFGIDPAEPCKWIKLYQIWRGPTTPEAKAESWSYLGPCFTPPDQSAREAAAVAAAAREMREKAVEVARKTIGKSSALPHEHIQLLPLPDTPALDRLLAEAREEEREACAKLADSPDTENASGLPMLVAARIGNAIRARSTPA